MVTLDREAVLRIVEAVGDASLSDANLARLRSDLNEAIQGYSGYADLELTLRVRAHRQLERLDATFARLNSVLQAELSPHIEELLSRGLSRANLKRDSLASGVLRIVEPIEEEDEEDWYGDIEGRRLADRRFSCGANAAVRAGLKQILILGAACREALQLEPPRKTALSPIHRLVGFMLPAIYRNFLGREFKITRSGQTPGGPALRFCQTVLNEAGIHSKNNKPFSPSSIEKYWKEANARKVRRKSS